MFLNEYQDDAISTAIYPLTTSIYYPALGLAGEYGELIEKMHKGDHGLILKEMGDLLWYIANLANDLECTLTEMLALIGCTATRFEQLELFALDSRGGLQVGNPRDFMGIKIGAICEKVKKLYRDDDGILTAERRTNILTSLAWVLIGICVLSSEFSVRVEPIAELNLRKLASRKQREVIHGDGDTR